MENQLSIYDYSDYRLFLRDIYNRRKETDKKFSHRFIAAHVGASSSGWFSDIINNRINLTRQYLTALCKLLHLSAREIDFFEVLVDYCQSGALAEKNRYMQKIFSFKEINPALVQKEQFEFYSKWYISAIRELLLLYNFKDDYHELARKLDPPIKPAQAKQAIVVLLSIGFIKQNREGFYKPVERNISKSTAFRSVYWANFVTSMMNLAIESIDRHSSDVRDISSVTVNLSPEGFKTAKAEIDALRKRLLALSGMETKQFATYQCNFQLFPLTQPVREKE
ncbi:MAG: TIGR02147 family protein [Fibrobacter sp.]|nr:TIGR02147 family protein [Fibrobacter sp.]